MRAIVLDTGPIVALFDASDRLHARAKAWLKGVDLPLYSNLAVVTEAIHLLDFHRGAAEDCLAWIEKAVQLDERSRHDWPRIRQIFNRYDDLRADFADASLVALAERLGTRTIATFDRDFQVYRWRDRDGFEIVP